LRASGFGPRHRDLRRISAIRQNHNLLKSLTPFWIGHLDDSCKRAIVNELYFALSRLGARDELLAIVGGWGDTMNDARTLDHLRAFNRNGTIFSKAICRAV
jgi:hypothetical protein